MQMKTRTTKLTYLISTALSSQLCAPFPSHIFSSLYSPSLAWKSCFDENTTMVSIPFSSPFWPKALLVCRFYSLCRFYSVSVIFLTDEINKFFISWNTVLHDRLVSKLVSVLGDVSYLYYDRSLCYRYLFYSFMTSLNFILRIRIHDISVSTNNRSSKRDCTATDGSTFAFRWILPAIWLCSAMVYLAQVHFLVLLRCWESVRCSVARRRILYGDKRSNSSKKFF